MSEELPEHAWIGLGDYDTEKLIDELKTRYTTFLIAAFELEPTPDGQTERTTFIGWKGELADIFVLTTEVMEEIKKQGIDMAKKDSVITKILTRNGKHLRMGQD